MKAPSILLCAMALLAGSASAQGVYKCVKDGQTSYSETPCTDGQLQIIEVPPPPAAVDKGAATRQERVASQLESARRQREQLEDQARERAARQKEIYDKHCAQLRLEQKWAAQDAVGAGDKTRNAAQLKARRAGERLAVECLN
ncbi:DUF4124 domain-containing protein [Janthinobacterium sp. BJB1]|uniref:DUF4124 domain-containing protein n=1 Tax=Janthinobacterium sp. GW458P TaxID=1981504 RepID=UPI000A31EED9|nr:DUF4124 domain-containing protein [Janthinobacterium sp. GW458P]MBE3025924.1 DUF4124 domain-containing protein [Janthinobacterium sp. GW458P]PHV14100.1 DUF4124 domain-containing protein [Janthinobacterium sp. BJB303]PJC96385.1 DUF4124 domain-containing protein [Janthinobacterium sp. BJB1]